MLNGSSGSALSVSSLASSTTDQIDDGFLPYEEPAIRTLLVLASFILLLNAINSLLDRLLYCGLVGQILIGVAWGAPGGNWLSIDAQKTIVQLGYLGLILLVYEGGLATSLSSVKQNAWLSACVAAIGIGLPISLSFVLMPLLNASPLQAFAAGAALCSTSLGTTFTVLSTCGLVSTRLGTILSSAAMMDDVIGLIMVQIVSNLGQGTGGDLSAGTALRPIGVSIALVVFLLVVCRFVIVPCSTRIVPAVRMILALPYAPVAMQSLFLVGIFTGSSYAGTSGLFAAYLAGAMLSWWDRTFQPGIIDYLHGGGKKSDAGTGVAVYESSYASVTNLLLKPLFFASIGFSVPISRLFGARIIWRGLVYTVLMLFAKLATGICLFRSSNHEARIEPTSCTDTANDSARLHENMRPKRDATGPSRRSLHPAISSGGGPAAQNSGPPALGSPKRLADDVQAQSQYGAGAFEIAVSGGPSTPSPPGRNLGTPGHNRAAATTQSTATLAAVDATDATANSTNTFKVESVGESLMKPYVTAQTMDEGVDLLEETVADTNKGDESDIPRDTAPVVTKDTPQCTSKDTSQCTLRGAALSASEGISQSNTQDISPNTSQITSPDTQISTSRNISRNAHQSTHEAPPAYNGHDDTRSTATPPAPPTPSRIYPSLLLGLAMTARGEIGYLIASVAQSSGIFSTSTGGSAEGAGATSSNDDIFLVVIWAVTLCTVIGPFSVGLMVRRIRRIDGEEEGEGNRKGGGGETDGQPRKNARDETMENEDRHEWMKVLGRWGAAVE